MTATLVSVTQVRQEPQSPKTLPAVPPHYTALEGTIHILFCALEPSRILQYKDQAVYLKNIAHKLKKDPYNP